MEAELIEQASTEIAEYSPVEAGLAELRSRLANVSYDLTTVKGMAVAKADRAEVRGLRTGLEAKRKEIKAPALAHCKLIDDEAKRITAELVKLEEPIDEQIKAREKVLEAEKEARELAERTRITAIHKRIAAIREFVALAAGCRTAARVDELLTKLSLTSLADFEEFGDEAAAAHLDAMERVTAILAEKTEQEAEQARIKQEQADAAAKLIAEREAFAAQQAAAKADADRAAAEHAAKVAAERAEFELAQAAAKVEAARLEAEHQAKVAAEAAEQARQRAAAQAELDRQRAELEAASAVAQAAAEAQRAALAAERAEFDARVLAEQQAKEKAEKEALALAEQAQAATQTIAPEVIEQVEAAVAIVDANRPPAPADIAPAATEKAAPDDAREEAAMWSAITAKEPSDSDVMWICISAVAKEYGLTTEQATSRLAAIDWTI